ncbi:ABC transporter substrate-binding protein [Paludibacterium yongneupense]|uniref:ABC transporter substrate-binding protein n=1 Tax=Paludibacterium yongneupense TaxID=400061 RepID=UPI000A055C6D|nr:ABC transporter substrate-binding protein [Paludibacterium yongneupense]
MISKWICTMSGIALLAGMALPAGATSYPWTGSDMAGRRFSVEHEPRRVVIQDGRDILTLALLDRNDPFARVVAWNNLLARNDPAAWSALLKRWPQAEKISTMNFGDDGQVNLETVLTQRPDLLIAQLRSRAVLQQSGVLERLTQLHIPVVFIDMEQDPVRHTMDSVSLLGKILNREAEAAQYVDFYRSHLRALEQGVAKEKVRPRVFIEALAGKAGADACCFTHGTIGWGALVSAVGGRNVGSQILPGPTGTVAMEKVLALQPDVYVMTGSQWSTKGSMALPYGYGSTPARVAAAFPALEARTGFTALKAVAAQRVYGIYHQFYNHPYNIVALEWLAKDFYPQRFTALDPDLTYRQIVHQFTGLPALPIVTGTQAPGRQGV